MKINQCLIVFSSLILFNHLAVAQEVGQTLPEVVVTANRTPTAKAASGSIISVITSEDLARKQVRFLADVLREVPGIAMSRLGPVGAQTQVRIRGTEANHTLVLIDGVEVNDPSGASEFDFNTLRAEDIERIEVLRGPQSALYGSDAIGGVINVITKTGGTSFSSNGILEGGSFGTGTAAVNARGSKDGVSYSIGFSKFSTDGVSFAPKQNGNTEQDGFDVLNLNAKLGIKLSENLKFEIVSRYTDSTLEFDEAGNVNGFSLPIDSDSYTDTEAFSGGFKAVLQTFDGQWEHILGVGLLDIERKNTDSDPSNYRGDRRKIYYQSNFFLDSSALVDASHTFTFLMENELDAQDVSGSWVDSDVESETTGFVGEYRLDLGQQVFLTASIRHDENDLFKNANTVRSTLAYLHKPTDTKFNVSYGEGIKNPTLFELYGYAAGFTPNPDLMPEESYGWDVGVEQRLWDGKAVISGAFFNNTIKNLIQGAGATAVNASGKNKIHGLEFELMAWASKNLQLKAQYSYTQAQDANGVQLIRRPKHVASLGSTYTCFDGRLNLGFQANYHGKQDDTAWQAVSPWGSETVQLDGYVLANMTAKYSVTESVSLFARVENIFDEKYEDVYGYANPGLGAYLGVKVSLGK